MKTKIKIVLIAALVFIAIFVVIQFFLPDKYLTKLFSKTGTLRVESTPKTNIFLNNSLIGQTPVQINLKEGVYTVKLVPESSPGIISYSASLRIFDKTTTYLNRELASKDLLSGGETLSLEKSGSEQAQIWVNTDPIGIIVALDGEDRGVSPVFMDNVSAGNHELSVRGEGFLPRSIKVNTVIGYKLTADFKLIIDEEYKKTKQAKKKKISDSSPTYLEILDTPTGWLRVRSEPSLNASESAQVNPGEQFQFFQEQDNWYEIEYEESKRGWVFGDYIKEIRNSGGLPAPSISPDETEN